MRIIKSLVLLWLLATGAAASANQSMPVPGAIDSTGRKVLTIVKKDPPGLCCIGNVQVAAEIANTCRVPIQILPVSLVPDVPAPGVFYGQELIAADGCDHNGQSSFQIVADALDMEGRRNSRRAASSIRTRYARNSRP
ncbi:MAG: hypothetical protein OEL20_07645 [Sulfuritalea sp.]|nr:hypothetical protein [Sulfuritalea sp.]